MIYGQMNHWIVIKHPSVQKKEMLYLAHSVFSTYLTPFHGLIFILLALKVH